jgi:hypothetical protein
MGWNLFKHRQSEGNLPLVEQRNAAFPFQASAGHNYDQWPWVYPAQTNQYTYFNCFYGNQLPSFQVYIERYQSGHPGAQLNRPWYTSTNKQQQNALQSQNSGVGVLQFGQQQAADYIAAIGAQWNAGGGRLKRSTRLRAPRGEDA